MGGVMLRLLEPDESVDYQIGATSGGVNWSTRLPRTTRWHHRAYRRPGTQLRGRWMRMLDLCLEAEVATSEQSSANIDKPVWRNVAQRRRGQGN